MSQIDTVFDEFLCFLTEWKLGKNPDKRQYYKGKVYYSFWDRFHTWVLDGIGPASMQAHLEYEKWKLSRNGITEDEMFEVILLEKLMYHFYLGDFEQITVLTQNFASRQLWVKHAELLAKLNQYGQNENQVCTKEVSLSAVIDVQPENANEKDMPDCHLRECFWRIRSEVGWLLEQKKIAFICQMLKQEIPEETIKKITDTDTQYLDIVRRYAEHSSMRIYQELLQKGSAAWKADYKIDLEQLDFFESQILEILQYYFKTQ